MFSAQAFRKEKIFHFNVFSIFYCCSITVVRIFPLLLSNALPTSHLPFVILPHHCLCPWVLSTCFLTWPFPFFYPLPLSSLPSGYCQFVLCFHIASSFCSFVCFVDYVPFIGEIIWYLSFTAWLISLSIILSSSIHAVAKGRSSFFLSTA